MQTLFVYKLRPICITVMHLDNVVAHIHGKSFANIVATYFPGYITPNGDFLFFSSYTEYFQLTCH